MTQALEIIKVEDVHGYLDGEGTVWLNVEDVARGLGFTETAASGNITIRWRTIRGYLKNFGYQPVAKSCDEITAGDYLPENIFYRLAMKASNAAAQKFQAKVADEILPAIRKNGVYMTNEAAEKILLNPDFIIKLAQQLKDANEKIAELKPKADYCEKILQSNETLPVTIIAKDYGMGAVMFNEMLRSFKIQFKVGRTWVLCQKYADKNYTETRTVNLRENFSPAVQMLWTQKGRMFLYNELKRHGILPVCEREVPMKELF